MKSKSTYCLILHLITSLILVVLVFVVLFTQISFTLYADNNPSENEMNNIKDSNKKDIENWSIKGFGIYSGIIISDELDTGFGIGAKLPRIFFNPSTELTSSVYFWGATKDSLDVSTLGIEESLMLIKSPDDKFSFFSGITVGYYNIIEKFDKLENNKLKIINLKKNSFESYLTTGITYKLKDYNSIFTQINYCLTKDSNELHILSGININK